jgi:hypothetical protein
MSGGAKWVKKNPEIAGLLAEAQRAYLAPLRALALASSRTPPLRLRLSLVARLRSRLVRRLAHRVLRACSRKPRQRCRRLACCRN